MRPTVFLPSAAAAALAAALVVPAAGHAQDRPRSDRDSTRRRDREVYVGSVAGPGARVWTSRDDEDRAALGVSLGAATSRRDTLGVRVTDVVDDGPAAKAGIEEGDRIVAVDGTSLRVDAADLDDPEYRDVGSRRLQRALAKHKPGDEVTLSVQRGRETRTVRVKTVAAADLPAARAFGFGPNGAWSLSGRSARAWADSVRERAESRPALGLTVSATGSRRDTLGVFVANVATDGPAERAGIVEGARIASIDNVDLRVAPADTDDPEIAGIRTRRFSRELEKHKAGDDVALRVYQNGAYRTVTVKAGRAADVWKNRDGFTFSFGDGATILPRVAPIAPLMPSAPPLPEGGVRIRTLPRTWMSAPTPPAAAPRLRSARIIAPGTTFFTAPARARRIVSM